MFFIYTERYSDFNSMIEQYEKEMRKLFEESRRANKDFFEAAEEAAVFPEDSPEVPQFLKKEQEEQKPVPQTSVMPVLPVTEEPALLLQKAEETEKPEENEDGSIIVEVTTAKGAVPVSGATVVIDRLDAKDPMGRKELVAVMETDGNGRTKQVFVPAAERKLSLEPGMADPFFTYYVSVSEKGYFPVKNRPADVFAKEISVLKTDLVPKPENLSARGMQNG